MFPPTIASDEHEILRGGFGGIAWIYTGIVAAGLAATIVLVPLALYFWLRSSRFVLTDRRLVVKPRIGKTQDFPLEQLWGAKVSIGSATDSVLVDGAVTLRLRYQREYEKLWGALLVLCHWPLPPSAPLRGAGCDWSGETLRTSSEITQSGLSVLSGDRFAFVPRNSGVQRGGIGKAAVLAVVGVREVKVRAEFPMLALIAALLARGGDFSTQVSSLAEALGGLVWSFAATKRQPSRRGLLVTMGDERLDVVTDEKSAAILVDR